ncbi:MAG: AAA family ATPase [Kiritimatiellae bacterium]|nr:AAA family ATPase [Kiritimatiellia bacterium]
MYQFIQANENSFCDLFQSLNGSCMRFSNETMPHGCEPSQADIGFEISPQDGRIQLCVQEGVTYSGESTSLQQWFREGVLAFDGIQALLSWLHNDLSPLMGVLSDNEVPSAEDVPTADSAPGRVPDQSSSPVSRRSAAITDTARVTEQIREDDDPVFLDEEDLFNALSVSVVGQDESLHTLASAVSGHVARSNPRRPLTIFAIGPSGVGKTCTGNSIVNVLNGSEQNGRYEFLRLDMCEYREAHRVSQLIGSPQGYVGYGEGAQLSDALARNPRTVVLFDEIEKAHPDILKVLMNAMDAGRLSTAGKSGDGSREVDCRKAVFFFSSNLECESVLRALEQRSAFANPETVDEICRGHLKTAGIPPELIGRIGHFLVYRPLGPESKAEITATQVRETAAEYGLDVRYVAPDVIIDIIQAVRVRGGGARVYAYQIDRLLGRVFTQAARQRNTGPIRILGPSPYSCEPMPDDDPTYSDAVVSSVGSGSTVSGTAQQADPEERGTSEEVEGNSPDNVETVSHQTGAKEVHAA